MLGFIDDNKKFHGKMINGFPVLGGLEWIGKNSSEIRYVIAIGDGLTFYSATALTHQSPTKQGYTIDIEQVATRSEVVAERGISLEEIEKGVSFVLKENNRVMKMDTIQEKYLKENIKPMSDLLEVPVPIVSGIHINHNFIDKSLYPR